MQNTSRDYASSCFRLEDRSSAVGQGIWTLTLDLPKEKVNKLGKTVLSEFKPLLEVLKEKGKSGEIQILVFRSGKSHQFIAGADIDLIRSAKSPEEAQALSREGQVLLNEWEDLPFATVASIDGPALGGGFEWSLASTHIIASDHSSVKIGLPEVMLGFVPGMGGCVRLPRRVGIAGALDLILTGKTLSGDKAYRAGVVDACISQADFDGGVMKWVTANREAILAKRFLGKEPKLGGSGGTMGKVLEGTPMGRALIYKKAEDGVRSKTKGQYPAPLEAISVLKTNGAAHGPKLRGSDREKAMLREAQGFGKLAASPISKNLVKLFFLTEKTKKTNGIREVTGEEKTAKARNTAVLGAGVMGGGIAQLLADKNISVRMKDISLDALTLGTQSATKLFSKSKQRRKISSREFDQRLNRIAPTLDYSGFKTTEVVVEAIVENLDVKRKVFRELEGFVSDKTVIASNTSSLSISKMQEGMKTPSRFVGMHFFNPVNKMPLIEVIRGGETSEDAVIAVYELSKQLGKFPIVVKDSPGFLVNRLLAPYLNEAFHLLKDGGTVEEIDKALLDFGMPMGPLELIDEIGLDVGDKVSHILSAAFGSRMEAPAFNAKFTETKRLGKKTNHGIYKYSEGGKKREIDPSLYLLIGVTPKAGTLKSAEIVDRCVLLMVNEAYRCLDEGVVSHPDDIDLGMIMGTGFPPFRGGLMAYAESRGLGEIKTRLEELAAKFGDRFAPSDALKKRV